MRKKTILIGFLIFTFIGFLFATIWHEKIVECPVCKTENTFKDISSYGGYIYNWPSKFEYIYWPVTHTYSLYSCKKCRYSAFMWDFEANSGVTLKLIKKAIDTLQIAMDQNQDYSKIPMPEKLETAEKFYKLYKTDNDFWCKFYRIKGFHYDAENEEDKAKESRLKALDIAENLLKDPVNDFRKNELLLITGAMKHLTGQNRLALIDFELAKTLEYNNPDNDSSNNMEMNKYLDTLLVEYIAKINAPDE